MLLTSTRSRSVVIQSPLVDMLIEELRATPEVISLWNANRLYGTQWTSLRNQAFTLILPSGRGSDRELQDALKRFDLSAGS